jgi:hypothetical protein
MESEPSMIGTQTPTPSGSLRCDRAALHEGAPCQRAGYRFGVGQFGVTAGVPDRLEYSWAKSTR